MVLGFQSALLSISLVSVLVPKGFAYTCIGNKCLYVEQIKLIHCSRAGLEPRPQAKETTLNNSTLLLRFNALVEVNFTPVIMEQFPNLETVDIRDNPIYCEGVGGGGS